MGLWRAVTDHRVQTDPGADDPALVGRTYAIPFGVVWDGAVRLVAGGLRGWRMIHWDDEKGVVQAEVKGLVFAQLADVTIYISLDGYGQTRVDVQASGRGSMGDLGANGRRVRKFFRALDADLEARPDQILNPQGELYARLSA